MKHRHSKFIGLLRGINVGGHNKIRMADLRSLCEEIGWVDVESYIQSGNLVFSAAATAACLEVQLEELIERHFGLQIPVIVREADDFLGYRKTNPFPTASLKEPNRVMLALSKRTPHSDSAERLLERAANGELITQIGDALWIHFGKGSAGSKLSTALIDRLVGSPVTARNLRTVLKLEALAASRPST